MNSDVESAKVSDLGESPEDRGSKFYHFKMLHRMAGLVYSIPNLKPSHRSLLLYMVHASNVKDGWRNWHGMTRAANALGLKKKTVRNTYTDLRKMGLLSRERDAAEERSYNYVLVDKIEELAAPDQALRAEAATKRRSAKSSRPQKSGANPTKHKAPPPPPTAEDVETADSIVAGTVPVAVKPLKGADRDVTPGEIAAPGADQGNEEVANELYDFGTSLDLLPDETLS